MRKTAYIKNLPAGLPGTPKGTGTAAHPNHPIQRPGTRRHVIGLVVMAALWPGPALAVLPADAAGCAAFYLANADVERDVFDAKDVDRTWTRQADAFQRVATRLNMPQADIDAIIGRDRPLLRRMIEGFILDLDPASRRLFITRSETCDRIVATAPEFEAWR